MLQRVLQALVVISLFIIPPLASGQTQDLPDLVVKEIACGSGNKLRFTVANTGTAMPSGWVAVANVYFDGVNMGHVDLGRPTTGDLTLAGGSASYLVAFDIVRTVEVKVVVDSTNSVIELSEENNEMVTKVSPCEITATPTTPTQTTMQVKFPDLVVKEIKCSQGKLSFTAANIGGPMPAGWWSNAAVKFDGVHMGNVALQNPTTGDLTPSGGFATYLTDFEITRTVKVEISVDASASVTELNEGNNYMYSPVEPCGAATATAITQDKQPDLVVKEIKCSKGRLYFTAANIGGPMPAGWWSNAAVKFDGVHMGNIALQNPTTGDLTPSGGFATYLTDFEITRPVKVEISVDASASVPELNEGNNYMYSPVEPCGAATTTAITQVTPTTGGGCIEKYMQVFGITYDEAKKLCAVGQAPGDVLAVINPCGELEKKLSILIEKLNSATGQDAESLLRDIQALKIELRSCQAKAPQVAKEVTPGIKNPCDEVKILQESIEQLKKKISYIEGLVVKGDMNKTDLEAYYTELRYLDERLDQMSFACQQGKPLDESPCARLSKLEIIYKEINDRLQAAQDEKSKKELNDRLASVAKEIAYLKQRCGAENLKYEQVESLYDLEKAYRAKQKIIVDVSSEKDLINELQKVEDEKKKLLEEYLSKLQELDARQTTIIKKIQIKGGELILDDLRTKANKVKVVIKDKDVEIETTERGAEITDGDAKVKGDIPLEYAAGALKSGKSGKEIKVLPSALIKGIEGKDYVKIDDEVTWLPITIIFKPTELSPQPDPPGITLPRGTTVEKLGEGHFKFYLPKKGVVEIKDYDRKTGEIGYVAIIDPDPPLRPVSGLKGSLKSTPKPEKAAGALSPSIIRELKLIDEGRPEYVADVEKTGRILGFIPADIAMEYRISAESGDITEISKPWWSAIAIINPDPPP